MDKILPVNNSKILHLTVSTVLFRTRLRIRLKYTAAKNAEIAGTALLIKQRYATGNSPDNRRRGHKRYNPIFLPRASRTQVMDLQTCQTTVLRTVTGYS